MELRWESVGPWNKKYTVSLFSANNPQSVDQHHTRGVFGSYPHNEASHILGPLSAKGQGLCSHRQLWMFGKCGLLLTTWGKMGPPVSLIRVPDFSSLAVTHTQIRKQTHNELAITILSITQQFLTQWPTSMGRLPDVPNENPSIIWRAGKNVVIHWAHWQTIHCIFMSKHIQGLTAEKQNREAIGTNTHTDKVQSPSPKVPS